MSGDDYTRLRVGGLPVGVVGLKAAIEELKGRRGAPEAEIAQVLLERLARSNYIPPGAQDDYRRALLREFKRALGEEVVEEQGALHVQVLGPGCPSCHSLEQMVLGLLSELGLAADVEHVTDRAEMARLGVFATPALVINGEVKAAGRLPDRKTLRDWLKEAASPRKG